MLSFAIRNCGAALIWGGGEAEDQKWPKQTKIARGRASGGGGHLNIT